MRVRMGKGAARKKRGYDEKKVTKWYISSWSREQIYYCHPSSLLLFTTISDEGKNASSSCVVVVRRTGRGGEGEKRTEGEEIETELNSVRVKKGQDRKQSQIGPFFPTLSLNPKSLFYMEYKNDDDEGRYLPKD